MDTRGFDDVLSCVLLFCCCTRTDEVGKAHCILGTWNQVGRVGAKNSPRTRLESCQVLLMGLHLQGKIWSVADSDNSRTPFGHPGCICRDLASSVVIPEGNGILAHVAIVPTTWKWVGYRPQHVILVESGQGDKVAKKDDS